MANVRVTFTMNTRAAAGVLRGAQVQSRMDNAAEAALTMQKALVPVDTGKLERSLAIRKTPDGLGRQVGSFGVNYAAAVENGHQTKSGKWVPAQPFVRPSIDAVRRVIRNG